MIRKLRTVIRIFAIISLCLPIRLFFSLVPKRKERTIILKLDEIGDYVLFRNFLHEIYKYRLKLSNDVILVGNEQWKSIFYEMDTSCVSSYIPINKDRLINDVFYTVYLVFKLNRLRGSVIVNPNYSRKFYFDLLFVFLISVNRKIGQEGNLTNTNGNLKLISDWFYSDTYKSSLEMKSEFERNREFFSYYLGSSLSTELRINIKEFERFKGEDYCVIFMGGRESYRRWDSGKYAQVADYMAEIHNLKVVLVGGADTNACRSNFLKHARLDHIDLVGKTSLLDFFSVVSNCKVLISNDSSAPHIALASGVEHIFVISSGKEFGRFVYKESPRYTPIFPEEMDHRLSQEQMWQLYNAQYKYDLSSIDINRVITSIESKLSCRGY